MTTKKELKLHEKYQVLKHNTMKAGILLYLKDESYEPKEVKGLMQSIQEINNGIRKIFIPTRQVVMISKEDVESLKKNKLGYRKTVYKNGDYGKSFPVYEIKGGKGKEEEKVKPKKRIPYSVSEPNKMSPLEKLLESGDLELIDIPPLKVMVKEIETVEGKKMQIIPSEEDVLMMWLDMKQYRTTFKDSNLAKQDDFY